MVRRPIIAKSTADSTSHAGLRLIGMAIRQRTHLAAEEAAVSPVRRDAMPHGDMLASCIALLCLGKSDFEAIEVFRADPYFHEALRLGQVPSASILRQRLDAHAAGFKEAVIEAGIEFLRRSAAPLAPLANGLVALDADVTPMNNAKTKKKGVSLADTGEDGFAPMAADLGQEGDCLDLELREGSQHCQKGTPDLLIRVMERARRLTAAPLLVRLDSGQRPSRTTP
jgi:hypothetical protein